MLYASGPQEGKVTVPSSLVPGFQRFSTWFRRAVRPSESERTSAGSSWKFRCVVTRDELDGGWIAECVDLPGAMSQGETQDEAMTSLIDAMTGIIALRLQKQLPERAIGSDDDAGTGAREFAVCV